MKGELNNKEVDRPSHGVHDRKRNLLRNVVKGELPRKRPLVVANENATRSGELPSCRPKGELQLQLAI